MMAWELLALWMIVVGTVTWFIRDERRLRAEADIARAARYYAHAPKYRHVSAEVAEQPTLPPRRAAGGLSAEQREFMQSMLTARRMAQD
jgi:hypothetical protein